MSKRKRFKKHLQNGRFYVHSDRNGGHPALLYKKRDQKTCISSLCLHLLQEEIE